MNLLRTKSIVIARSSQRGYAVISLLVMLSVMLLFIMANMHYLRDLNRELRLTERQQIQRLQKRVAQSTASVATNAVPTQATIVQTNP
jgi:hypothetical protein